MFRGQALEVLPGLDTANRSKCAIGYRTGRLWISYPWSGGAGNFSLVYHTETQRWFNEQARSY
jgi:hypothetical protein